MTGYSNGAPVREAPGTKSDHGSTERQFTDLSEIVHWAWRGKWFLLLGIAAAVAIGYYYCSVAAPVYESQAAAIIKLRQPGLAGGTLTRRVNDPEQIADQIALLTSPSFIGKALANPSTTSLSSLAANQGAVSEVIQSLWIERGQDAATRQPNNVLNFSYRSLVQEDCEVVLAALIETYNELSSNRSAESNDQTVVRVEQRAAQLRTKIQDKQQRLQRLHDDSPLAWTGNQDIRSSQYRMIELEKQKSALEIRRAETEERLATFKQAKKDGADRDTLLAMIPESLQLDRNRWLEERLYGLVFEEQELLKDFGAGHPDVRTVREQISFTRAMMSAAPEARAQMLRQVGVHDNGQPSAGAVPELYIASLDHELREIAASEKVLSALLKEAGGKAKVLADYEHQFAQLKDEIARDERIYEGLMRQLQDVSLGTELSGSSVLNVISRPSPGIQVAPKLPLVLAIAAFLGLNLGALLAFLWQLADKRFANVRAIHNKLGLSVAGLVPVPGRRKKKLWRRKARRRARLDRILRAYHAPQSEEAEAYRTLRTSLYFGILRRSRKVIQITTTTEADASAVIAANLAVSIAQSGKKTLLIDADVRVPRVHDMFDVVPKDSLASVITGQSELDDAVYETPVKGLDVLPSQTMRSNPMDLLALPQFDEMLAYLRERYDVILLHTSALLTGTDPLIVAPRVDGVLLTIFMPQDRRADAIRVKTQLESVGANLLGAIACTPDFKVPLIDRDIPKGYEGLPTRESEEGQLVSSSPHGLISVDRGS